MITQEEFNSFINNYQAFKKSIDRFGKALGGKDFYFIYECDWYGNVDKMLDIFLESHFTEDGQDLITWWLFEDVEHIIEQTVDPDLFHGKSEIEYNVEEIWDLWDYMVKYKKDYFKDAE